MSAPTSDQVIAEYQRRKTEADGLFRKLNELDAELSEHRLVGKTLAPLLASDPSRRCYQLVGGVLVERTVADVAPAVARNGDALEAVIERQAAGLQAKERELADFTARYKIRVRRGDEAEEAQQQQQQSQAEGMLVADQPALPSVKEED